jgi:hypothetical protein
VRPRIAFGLALTIAAATLLAGCGGGGKSTTATSTTGASPAATIAQIKDNWTKFFDGSTSASDRTALLQNGPKFAQIMAAINSSPLATGVKAKVTRVKLLTPSTASVTYTILLSGQPVLPNAKGTAVLDQGVWKVGAGSFCGLVKLETGGGAVPAVCAHG